MPLVLTVTGTDIATSYAAPATSSAIGAGRKVSRLRFYVHIVTAATSDLVTVTVKLQQRYNEGGVSLAYKDLPSDKGDASKTFEVEHAFTVSANSSFDFNFFLSDPQGVDDIVVAAKGNAAGKTGDVVTIYSSAG